MDFFAKKREIEVEVGGVASSSTDTLVSKGYSTCTGLVIERYVDGKAVESTLFHLHCGVSDKQRLMLEAIKEKAGAKKGFFVTTKWSKKAQTDGFDPEANALQQDVLDILPEMEVMPTIHFPETNCMNIAYRSDTGRLRVVERDGAVAFVDSTKRQQKNKPKIIYDGHPLQSKNQSWCAGVTAGLHAHFLSH